MTSLTGIDILAIFALCLTISFANRNIVFNNEKNKLYIIATVTTVVLLLLELATVYMELSDNEIYVIPYRIANILGFSLSPAVPFILFFFNTDKTNKVINKTLLFLPICINALVCILSFKTGWIFYVDAQNQYTRGDLFLLPTIVSIFYYILLIIAVMKNNVGYEKDDKKVLLPISLMPMLCVAIQIINTEVLIIWSSTAISLLLYYIYLRELQFTYDVPTQIKNRAAFEKEIEKYAKNDANAVLVVLDLNNLKKINDNYGHKAGDEAIFRSAKLIQQSFKGVGIAYRIGGDEFCVICKEASENLVEMALSKLDDISAIINQKRNFPIVLAHGYALYKKQESESIFSVFTEADSAMYDHKAKIKGYYGRQREDEINNNDSQQV